MNEEHQRYIEIYYSPFKEYHVDIRWVADNEQHESHYFDTIEEVTEFVTKFYKEEN